MGEQKKIPDAARQGIIDKLILIGEIQGGIGSYRSFFERVYPECKTILYNGTTLAAEIGRHCDSFPGDWGNDNGMFSVVNVLSWTDQQFLYFCKEYVNPVFNRFKWDDEREERIDIQPKCVEAINLYLTDCGYELREASKVGDKVTYDLVELSGVKGTIQGVVFAAVFKPDFLFTDFLNQEVTIPVNDDNYLYYDQKISAAGLSWKTLNEWYSDTHPLGERLIDRLWKSVRKCGSPIEKTFFSAYLEFAEEYGDDIPALLPQVYLYYDSKVQKERLKKIFEHQCMDFLLIISESRRIVIELDGIQHYAEDNEISLPGYQHAHIASVSRYASMVSAQRDMVLAGYEVYRFGGKELYQEEIGKRLVKQFLKDLFIKHGLIKEE